MMDQNVFFIIHKFILVLKFNKLTLWMCLLISFGLSLISALLAVFVINPIMKKRIEKKIQVKLNQK